MNDLFHDEAQLTFFTEFLADYHLADENSFRGVQCFLFSFGQQTTNKVPDVRCQGKQVIGRANWASRRIVPGVFVVCLRVYSD